MSGSRSMAVLVVASLLLAGCGRSDGWRNAEAPSGSLASKERTTFESARPASAPDAPIPVEHAPLPPSVSGNGQFRSGTLTAGSLDDQAKFDEYSAYLLTAIQHDPWQYLFLTDHSG